MPQPSSVSSCVSMRDGVVNWVDDVTCCAVGRFGVVWGFLVLDRRLGMVMRALGSKVGRISCVFGSSLSSQLGRTIWIVTSADFSVVV